MNERQNLIQAYLVLLQEKYRTIEQITMEWTHVEESEVIYAGLRKRGMLLRDAARSIQELTAIDSGWREAIADEPALHRVMTVIEGIARRIRAIDADIIHRFGIRLDETRRKLSRLSSSSKAALSYTTQSRLSARLHA
jgi:hypothetical protein